MKTPGLDKETKQVIDKGRALKELVTSAGWGIARADLYSRLVDLTSVLGIQEKDPGKLAMEIGSRQLAADIMINWLKEVEGTAAQHENNKALILQASKEEYIKIYS